MIEMFPQQKKAIKRAGDSGLGMEPFLGLWCWGNAQFLAGANVSRTVEFVHIHQLLDRGTGFTGNFGEGVSGLDGVKELLVLGGNGWRLGSGLQQFAAFIVSCNIYGGFAFFVFYCNICPGGKKDLQALRIPFNSGKKEGGTAAVGGFFINVYLSIQQELNTAGVIAPSGFVQERPAGSVGTEGVGTGIYK